MEGCDDGRDNVGAPDDGLIVSVVIQENVERNLVYILIPGARQNVLQNDPTAHQLELPNESLAGIDAGAH